MTTPPDHLGPLAGRVKELEAENKRLREALEFYADIQNWTEQTDYDAGERARQSLR